MLLNNGDHHTINELFEQLGLDSSDEAIEQFIADNQLPEDVPLNEAPFFSESQRNFISEAWKMDAVFVMAVEELNARIHGN
ncbi:MULTISPECIES: DUF2789 family protein [Moraxella]|uniref:DUF2789 domain-containing protein n=1 Tax=Moraxella catarrhalis TaxID=480 RepID=A0A198UY40_MORCA|nr:DUF2789 family protein [Moraxella catarrhalis]OAU96202.1 hypothetical protein AO383_1654 [Moraxella catarrhalis]OAU96469.1 hypothetical protein AO385_1833 [Moraxella catarrhalis]OAU97734.1 hypothetical protein AO384_0420 [Moraxella catarrhalis]OAV01261.1 hypothetical protein AO382_0757 [Moraxella catarrhalis]STY81003.1 Protein of uncharacterised function (DUF2789) [Moraxella catarrhalis]